MLLEHKSNSHTIRLKCQLNLHILTYIIFSYVKKKNGFGKWLFSPVLWMKISIYKYLTGGDSDFRFTEISSKQECQ
ncbi:MAG: hypothetical protein HEQ33_01365 [Dolichospermum sp. WA123]|nr:hypothetical protein [Dolichospermum sp. WA123]